MALALYFDLRSKRLVNGPTDPDTFKLPIFFEEDGLELQVFVLERTSAFVPPLFRQVPLTGYALNVAIGSAGTQLAQQNVWALSADNLSLTGTVNLSTAAMAAAFGSAGSITKLFEIRLTPPAGLPYRQQWDCTIRKSVATTGALAAVPGDSAIGRLEASRIFVRKEMAAGEGILFTSADGAKRVLWYLDNDGTMQCAPVT